ncbi:MAG: sensor histidine kinase [Lewinellaceae bacterium]|nr:sensor histidine kinase [Lewinellaceae bacterium]
MLETNQADPLEVYYEEIAGAHEKMGNYKEALFWYKKFMVLDDSLFKADNVKSLADIETKYQTARKEAEIRDLENQQKIHKILTYSALSGILALLVVLWLSRRAYRQKQRLAEQERLLQQEKIDRLESERKVVALNAHLEGQQRERLRIAEDLHDDFGSGLSKISLLSEVSKKKTPASGELDKIADTAKELLLKMSEVVWALNHHNDTLPSLAAYIRRYTSGFFEDSGVRCHFNIPDLPETPLSGETRRNVFLVIKEALHNVLKHAAANKVEIDISMQGGAIRIVIRDNGKGFDQTTLGKAGNGLLNMEKRMKATGGSFSVESTPGKGTITRIVLPLEKEALSLRHRAA